MAAPLGNQFWRNRSQHGREKLFASAELLWEAAVEYFNWCDENPWYKNEKGNKGEIVKIPTARPYTLTGLCIYLNVNTSYWSDFKKGKDIGEDFSEVISRIESAVYTQKFEGAAVGAFNANIISRDLGLVDKKESDVKVSGIKVTIEEPDGD